MTGGPNEANKHIKNANLQRWNKIILKISLKTNLDHRRSFSGNI